MCETKIKNIFQEKLEINDNIIIERAIEQKEKQLEIIQHKKISQEQS